MLNLISMNIKQYLNFKTLLMIQIIGCVIIFAIGTTFSNFEDDFLKSQKISLAIINQDDNPLIKVLIDSFNSNENFTSLFNISIDDEQESLSKFKRGDIDAYIIIPNGFTKGILGYQKTNLKIYSHAGFPTQTILLKELFSSYSRYVQSSSAATITLYNHMTSLNFDSQKIHDINNRFSFEMIGATMGRAKLFNQQPIKEIATQSGLLYFVIALSFSMIGFNMIPIVNQCYINMRSNVSKRIIISGTSPLKIIFAQHITHSIISLFNISFIIFFVLYFGNIKSLYYLLSVLFITLFWSTLFLSIALVVDNKQSYVVITSIATLLLSLIGGSFTPYMLLPIHLKMISHFSPIYTATRWLLNNNSNYTFDFVIWLLLIGTMLYLNIYYIKNRYIISR